MRDCQHFLAAGNVPAFHASDFPALDDFCSAKMHLPLWGWCSCLGRAHLRLQMLYVHFMYLY